MPGSPSILYYSNTNAVAKLTSLVNSSFINEVHGSFQRNLSVQNAAAPPGATNESLGITPMTPGVHPPPGIILIARGYNLMGIFGPSCSPTNQIQVADQISWIHGSIPSGQVSNLKTCGSRSHGRVCADFC